MFDNRRLLLISDDQAIQQRVKHTADRGDRQLELARTLEEGFFAAISHPQPSVIVIDADVPAARGWEVVELTETFCEHTATRHCIKVMIAGATNTAAVNLAWPFGLSAHVRRAFAISQLHYRIENAVHPHHFQSILRKKKAEAQFDVFLCYNSVDRDQVIDVAKELNLRGLTSWLDVWNIRPGDDWQKEIERNLSTIGVAAVFVGAGAGVGSWQREEIGGVLQNVPRRGTQVIPVLLQGKCRSLEIPLFLQNRMWVDLNNSDPDPYDNLAWGITGISSDC